jgi:hypothetical protein
MTRLMTWLVVGALGLGSAPAALAQSPPCNPEWLRGVWLLTCEGFTDLSKINPGVEEGTLVPVAMQARMVIDRTGRGKGQGVGSLGGVIFTFDKEEVFALNADCTAEKSYTLHVKEMGGVALPPDYLVLTGSAASVLTPMDGQIRTLIREAGDVVSCTHKKMFNGVAPE